MQDFSIQGIKKQWEWQQSEYIVKRGMPGGPLEGQEHHFKKIGGFILPEQMGCKTETRRMRGLREQNEYPDNWEYVGNHYANEHHFIYMPTGKTFRIKCPYGVVGDEIWVKEKWGVGTRPHPVEGWVDGFEYAADMSLIDEVEMLPLYKTDIDISEYKSGWKSPLFMPKTASRIKLEITGIGLERLYDITEEGALREGVFKWIGGNTSESGVFAVGDIEGSGTSYSAPHSAVHIYNRVFKEIHGEELFAKNPWVWVIRFTVKSWL